jgi:hypothetical protein
VVKSGLKHLVEWSEQNRTWQAIWVLSQNLLEKCISSVLVILHVAEVTLEVVLSRLLL